MPSAVCSISNYWKYYLLYQISSHTFRAIIMQPGFTFNRDVHKQYSDISTYEIPTAHGYATGGINLLNPVIAQDDINDRGTLSFDDLSFVPSGADISLSGAIILDATDDVIVAFASAGGTVVAIDGLGVMMRDIQGRIH